MSRLNVNALVAPLDWPSDDQQPDVEAPPRLDQRPHAFAVLIGACVYRVAGDGSVTIVMLPAGMVIYLRTGVHPRGR